MNQSETSFDGAALALDAGAIGQLAALTGNIGLAPFYAEALAFLRRLVDAEMGVVLQYSLDQRPQYLAVQADAARHRGARETVYLDGPYALDPVYQMFQRGQGDGAYAMASYVPDDFYDSEFYRCFFHNTHLIDTIDVLWRIDARSTIAFCMGREEGRPPFNAGELPLVRQVLPLLFAAMGRHHQLVMPQQPSETDRLVHLKVQSTMANFGASLLTKREREVVFYMLSGYSSAQTAARLHTAEGTIRNQRKSIHHKLETSSQAELFSLFIHCIPFAEPDTDIDPLVRYQSPAPRTPAAVAQPHSP
jgi:DNA-binding CsgD family transcriptional regulator